MPELPEMENYKLMLHQRIVNMDITDVQINRIKSINVSPEVFIQVVKMRKVVRIERRAKHLLFHLDNGFILLLHLMLGGWMFYGLEEEKPNRTIQVRLSFGERNLYFIGLRLGYLHLYDTKGIEKELADLGPEPLLSAFTQKEFFALVRKKRGKLKPALIDQGFIAGIGNRYSDEICYEAKILPSRQINQLNESELVLLFSGIKLVLQVAIRRGGYMEHPFFNGDSLTGGFETLLKVHGRQGERCERCGSTIQMEKISSHKTYFCKGCQF